MAHIRVGCAGWSYDDWVGPFYPPELPPAQRLAYYATRFDTVEINSTFYRLPSEHAVQLWHEQAPDGFLFSLKLGSFGSHRRKLREPQSWLPNHIERFAPLGAGLGPTVVQLPPRWRRNVARLEEFLACATGAPDVRWAVELRDPTWVHDEVFEVLARYGAALVLHDLLVLPRLRTTNWTYLRFHGPDARHQPYRGRYGPARLSAVADELHTWCSEGIDVYAYFNNDYETNAVHDAETLRALLADRGDDRHLERS